MILQCYPWICTFCDSIMLSMNTLPSVSWVSLLSFRETTCSLCSWTLHTHLTGWRVFCSSRSRRQEEWSTTGSVSESRGLTIPLCNPTMRSVSIKSSCNPSVTTSLCFVRSSCSQAFVADSCKKGFNIDILWKSVAEISSAKWSPVFFPLLDTWEEYSPFSLASD